MAQIYKITFTRRLIRLVNGQVMSSNSNNLKRDLFQTFSLNSSVSSVVGPHILTYISTIDIGGNDDFHAAHSAGKIQKLLE